MTNLIEAMSSRARQRCGFLSVEEVCELAKRNFILDPASALIGRGAVLGEDNVVYPNVILQLGEGSCVTIGSRNVFYPGFLALADGGDIEIGDDNRFGDGLVSLKANMPGSRIVVGCGGRYLNGVTVLGRTVLGDGSQVLGGPVSLQDCELVGGDTFTGHDPDRRAGVLKGMGVARELRIDVGHVVNGAGGVLTRDMIELQRKYHPQPTQKTSP